MQRGVLFGRPDLVAVPDLDLLKNGICDPKLIESLLEIRADLDLLFCTAFVFCAGFDRVVNRVCKDGTQIRTCDATVGE